jgi:hypothetical protein
VYSSRGLGYTKYRKVCFGNLRPEILELKRVDNVRSMCLRLETSGGGKYMALRVAVLIHPSSFFQLRLLTQLYKVSYQGELTVQ